MAAVASGAENRFIKKTGAMEYEGRIRFSPLGIVIAPSRNFAGFIQLV
jgi:hypothetical protein